MKKPTYSPREKLLVTAMVIVVSIFLFHRFVGAPYRSRLDELQTITARKERQVRRLKTLLASRKEIEGDYARLFNSRTGDRPLPGEMGAFLKSIEKLARSKNVRILDIRPRSSQNRTNPSPLSVAPTAGFVTESSWPSLANFLVALEGQRVEVEKITLTRSAHQSKKIKAQIQLTQE